MAKKNRKTGLMEPETEMEKRNYQSFVDRKALGYISSDAKWRPNHAKERELMFRYHAEKASKQHAKAQR